PSSAAWSVSAYYPEGPHPHRRSWVDVTVSSRNAEISDALRSTTQEKIGRLSRFLDGMERAEVHFFEEKNPRIAEKEVCEVTMEGHGYYVRAKVSAHDKFVAVDRAVDKLEQQLHKLKTKLHRRSHPKRAASVDLRGSPNALDTDVDAADDGERQIRIVKTKRFLMKPMPPEEATQHMDLLGHDFFFFTNAETSRAAVVYRRSDGDVGLIDEAD
ncbi:MAG: ribosome hibernation-promoting factor, HPF/YfiA family, partial [Actinomycetota bacterium]